MRTLPSYHSAQVQPRIFAILTCDVEAHWWHMGPKFHGASLNVSEGLILRRGFAEVAARLTGPMLSVRVDKLPTHRGTR